LFPMKASKASNRLAEEIMPVEIPDKNPAKY
jgi:hypothetical protein